MSCPCNTPRALPPSGSILTSETKIAEPSLHRSIATGAMTVAVTGTGAAIVQLAVGERNPSMIFARAIAVGCVAQLTGMALAHGRAMLDRPDPQHDWVARSYRLRND